MSHAPTSALRQRHAAVRQSMARPSTDGVSGSGALDALIVTASPNITYLTNFTGSAAIVVLTAERLYFLTDSRYVTSMNDRRGQPSECPDLELVVVDGAYDVTLSDLLGNQRIEHAGFEAGHLTVARFEWLKTRAGRATFQTSFHATEGMVEAVRVVKDDHELTVFREAGRRLSNVTREVLTLVKSGMTEREVGFAIDACIRNAGFSRNAFETIVASGPNAALPHARPTERKLVEGDLVVLDFGGVYDSYCVDLTRTVVVGRASDRARQVHAAVREAHDRALAAVGPGVSRFGIDRAARDVLAAAGMGEAFGHGTGHGLGIEIHEEPRIARRRANIDVDVRDEFVRPGMVFTVEPGAYFPGWGGVRIEDDVMVTASGSEMLTSVTTELIEVD